MTNSRRVSICPPGTEAVYTNYHFSPATRVGDMIWVSGQVGSDRAGVPGADMETQARLAFANLQSVLAAAGAGLGDIVDLMTFHTHFHRDIQAFAAVKDEFLPANFPSWTAIGVTELAHPDYLVEVRAIAVRESDPS
jgi:enamine deaminase RidA (YjgF/YER057c/UK114 family)